MVPVKAPARSEPSTEMLIVPAFSATSSPRAAKAMKPPSLTALPYIVGLVKMSASAEKKSPIP